MKNLKLLALVAALASTTAFDANAAMRRSRTPQAQSVETPSPRFQEPAVQRQDSSSSSQSQEDISSYRVVPNSPQALVLFPNQDQPKAFGSPQLVQFFNRAAQSKAETAQLKAEISDINAQNNILNLEIKTINDQIAALQGRSPFVPSGGASSSNASGEIKKEKSEDDSANALDGMAIPSLFGDVTPS